MPCQEFPDGYIHSCPGSAVRARVYLQQTVIRPFIDVAIWAFLVSKYFPFAVCSVCSLIRDVCRTPWAVPFLLFIFPFEKDRFNIRPLMSAEEAEESIVRVVVHTV
jgi:hypothetical protein